MTIGHSLLPAPRIVIEQYQKYGFDKNCNNQRIWLAVPYCYDGLTDIVFCIRVLCIVRRCIVQWKQNIVTNEVTNYQI